MDLQGPLCASALTLTCAFGLSGSASAADAPDALGTLLETDMFTVNVPAKWQIDKRAGPTQPVVLPPALAKIAPSAVPYEMEQITAKSSDRREVLQLIYWFVPLPRTPDMVKVTNDNATPWATTMGGNTAKTRTFDLGNGTTLDEAVSEIAHPAQCEFFRRYRLPSGTLMIRQATQDLCAPARQLADSMSATFRWKGIQYTAPSASAQAALQAAEAAPSPGPHASDPYPMVPGSSVSATLIVSKLDNDMHVEVRNDGTLDVRAVAFSLTDGPIRYKETVRQFVPCLRHMHAMKPGEIHVSPLGLMVTVMGHMPIAEMHPYVIASVFSDGSTWGNPKMIAHLQADLARCAPADQ